MQQAAIEKLNRFRRGARRCEEAAGKLRPFVDTFILIKSVNTA